MNRLLIVVGTRPNFVKVTQFKRVAENYPGLELAIVHTGQHYDRQMADVFFDQFGLRPDFFLGVEAGSPNTQIAKTMLGLEELVNGDFPADMIMVVGDVNATLAGSVAANKMGVPVSHLEGGLRSFDRSMPEEVNRALTDQVTDTFFVTEESGVRNLKDEGVQEDRIHRVGNTMIDTMVAYEEEIDDSGVMEQYGLEKEGFVLMTIHRPATVDHKEGLEKLLELVDLVTEADKAVFPAHPRTMKNLKEFGLLDALKEKNILLLDPLDYFSFQKLIKECRYVLTDSGGIQEETTFRRKPCLTFRKNTERPSTVDTGTNTLLPLELYQVRDLVEDIRSGRYKKGTVPPLWDGRATERVMEILTRQGGMGTGY